MLLSVLSVLSPGLSAPLAAPRCPVKSAALVPKLRQVLALGPPQAACLRPPSASDLPAVTSAGLIDQKEEVNRVHVPARQ